jgi:aspartate aminotransferase-like enzyme
MIHHRTPAFDALLKKVLTALPYLFQTKQQVFMHTSTGSGAMESALVNILSPGDRVLAVVSGKFGERWADMAEVFGARVERLTVPWGEAVEPQKIKAALEAHPETRAVLCQACETSTATAHDIRSIGEIVAASEALLVVDGITAVGAYPLAMDDFKIDVLIAGSQKAVMLPTGLSLISLSEKAWKVAEKATCPRFYFDLRREKKANAKGETLFSSPVSLIKALDYVLGRIQEAGLDRHFQQLRRRAEFTRTLLTEMQLEIYSQSPANSVTAIKIPAGIDGIKLRTHLEEKYQLTVMGGQEQLKGKILRYGHMGYISDDNLIESMTRLAQALNDFGAKYDITQIRQKAESWLKAHSL